MKAVILAGGFGYRLGTESIKKPKPLIKVGEKPLIWYIMKNYSYNGINDFIICTGYKHEFFNKFFKNFDEVEKKSKVLKESKNSFIIRFKKNKSWNIKIVFTGLKTNTGGRIKKISKFIKQNENFCVTYSDSISDINLKKEINFHLKKKKIATLAAVSVPNRFGILKIKKDSVKSFFEKPLNNSEKINGGYFIFSYKIFKYIKSFNTILEDFPMKQLSKINQLNAYKHNGFWQTVDNVKDKKFLENLIRKKTGPWAKNNQIWKNKY
jgi:glucose-1-phosphate cytidylyltransferase